MPPSKAIPQFLYRNAVAASIVAGLAALLVSLVLYGIMPRRPAPVTYSMLRVKPQDMPRFADDLDPGSLVAALSRSRDYFSRQPPDRRFSFGPDAYTAADLLETTDLLSGFFSSRPSQEEIDEFIRKNFLVYRASGAGPNRSMLVTGYYEPRLAGSLTRSEGFCHPLYGQPDDVVTADLGLFLPQYKGRTIAGRLEGNKLVPLPTREEIETSQVYAGRGLELLWVSDPVDAFFLQIQGSGQVMLEDGTVLHVHYAGENGRPYRSVGGLLLREGKIPREEMSMQAIRKYLAEHPEDRDRVLNHNESYVFFQMEAEGPLGCLEVPLTPGRSIALDRKVFPLGAPAFLQSKKPADGATEGSPADWKNFSRFTCAQDTGGAITGSGRVDLFWGSGPEAEYAAGHMQEPGTLYFLVRRPPAR
ncbi:MAG: MltA domain-containing protein [Thermodesulfobacteriota bacterium]